MQYIWECQNTDEKHDIFHPQKTLSPSAQKPSFNIAGPYMIRYFKILFRCFSATTNKRKLPPPSLSDHQILHWRKSTCSYGAIYAISKLPTFWNTPSIYCCKKCSFGVCGNTVDTPSHERHSHHIGLRRWYLSIIQIPSPGQPSS